NVLDIAVARVGPVGLDPDGDQISFRCSLEGSIYFSLEMGLIDDQMIARANNDLRMGVSIPDFVAGISNTGSSIPFDGFGKDIVLRYLRQLFPDQMPIFIVGDYHDPIRRGERRKAVVGHL